RQARNAKRPAFAGRLNTPALSFQVVDQIDVGLHGRFGAGALDLVPRIPLRAADHVGKTGPLALDITAGRLLVERIQPEQRRVVGAFRKIFRICDRRLELPLEIAHSVLPVCKRGAKAIIGSILRREEKMANRSARRERVSPIDTAWLRMDTPCNLMMIVGVMVLGGGFDFARLRRVVQTRLLNYRRFRSRVVSDPTGSWWEEVEPDLDQHLVRVGLPGKGSKEDLERLVAQLASQ